MKTFPPLPLQRRTRVSTALLVSFMILVTPVMPLASSPALSARIRPADGYSPAAASSAPAAIISATKTDSFPDPNADGKAEPGDTITYDVNVSNSGASDAAGVTFTDTIDPNTTLVPGSLRVSPVAFADAYNATRDTALSIPGPGVLANDTGTPQPTAQPIAGGATTQGGTVTLAADGSFNYTPPAGFDGSDTFTYTATNGLAPDDTATVTINVDAGPAVTTTSPANGATNVTQNANITVNFTEPVNATTGSFSVQCPAGSPQTFTLSASPSASFTLDPTADLPAGTTCTVTVTASQITDADTFDPPDQLAADHTFSFGVRPLALDDMRSATGNARIDTSVTGYSVLANDQGPGAAITAFDATSAHGGNVTMNTTTGTFTYDPPRGFTGTDGFNYTISNAAGSDQGTVVLTVSDMVWFINNAPGACASACDGRLTHPFTSLADFEAVNGNGTVSGGAVIDPEAGDNIFIYTGVGNYTAPLTLEASQRVVGQGATSSLAALTLITFAPDSAPLPSTGGTAPSITSGGNGFNVVSDNQLYGLHFEDTGGAAVNSNADVGTLVIGDVTINNDGSSGAGVVLDDGGASVTSTGVNTINTRSATALNVTNTDIGAGDLTFRSISAGNADANPEPTNGIVLSNTGSSGGLVVTGNSAGLCGGAVGSGPPATPGAASAPAAADCTGGVIRNTSGAGIVLNLTRGVSLTRMRVAGSGDDGIQGTSVTDFALISSLVEGNGNATAEANLDFGGVSDTTPDGLFGTASITGSTVRNSPGHNVSIRNQSGTLSLTATDSQFTNVSANTLSDDGLTLGAVATASMNVNVRDSYFEANRGDHFQAAASDSATLSVIFKNNTLKGGHASALAQGVTINAAGAPPGYSGRVDYDVDGNNIQGATLTAVVTNLGISSAAAVFNGFIRNNVIGAAGVPLSGSSSANCIAVDAHGNGAHRAAVTNNTLRRCFDRGIVVMPNDGNGSADVTVTGNTVNDLSDPNARDAFFIQTGATTANVFGQVDSHAVCLDITGNNMVGGAAKLADIRLRQRFRTGIRLPGYAGSAFDTAAVEAFVEGNNLPADAVAAASNDGTVTTDGYFGGPACAGPTALETSSLTDAPTDSAVAQRTSYPTEPRTWSDIRRPVEASADDEEEVASDAGDNMPALYGARIVRASYNRPAAARVRRGDMFVGDAVVPTAGAYRKGAVNVAKASAASAAPFSGETVNANVGTLPAGKTVHIQFQVTVDNPFGGTSQVSNQGTVSGANFGSVLTDDPAVGGSADATVTPVLAPPSISIKDASVAEPATGSATAAFAVTLSHAYSQTVTVNFATADDAGGATSGSDYTVTSGTLTFNPGETVQTISVPVLSDADATETSETFLVDISGATAGATINDAQAVGTITPDSTPGTVVISELRTSGPAGADDDFVELLNNTDAAITVAASDASGGWSLVKSGTGCSATPVVVAFIPNGTVIPARSNYLVTGSAYSLGAYAAGDQTLVFNIEDDRNVALFNTADLANVSTVARLDAVGFGSNAGGNCDLLREGATLQPAAGSTSEHSFVRKVDKGAAADTNENAADFAVVSTTPASAVGGNASPTLGAPGPENSTGARGPVPCGVEGSSAKFDRSRLDSTAALGSAPNTARDANGGPNAANGTIDFRRRFTNNTGGAVTQLRFRITNVKDTSTPGAADLRALSSATFVVSVNDPATCGGSAPCNVTVVGTTLEQPPSQSSGGGVNSTLGVGSITTATPLPAGASVNLRLLFGVQQVGDYHLSFVIETTTAGSIGQDVWELRGNTETGGASEGGCNTPPVADAGADQTVECSGGSVSVTLDGSASTDADGDTLAYEWREGATVLGTGETLNTSLPFGPHTITLKVTDPSGDFGEDAVSVNIVDTADPVITAPPNVSVNTGPGATSCGAFVSDETLGSATASDGCSASVTVTRTGVPAGNVFPVGTTVVTYTADDGHGHTRNAYQSVTVTDNTPPTVTAPANIKVNAPANSCSVSLDPGMATAGDNCDGVMVAGVRSDAQPLNAPYPVGTTTITWTATDAHGNTASAAQTVKVNDVTAPTITLTTGTINLSPPNHQYQTFSIANLVASVSDSCDAGVDINDVVISRATSDEPEDASGNGDGNTVNDIVIAPDCKSLQLRSERGGGGDGRVYTITLQVKDSSGNLATAVRKVFVPRSGPAVDGGALYAVNGCAP